MTKAAINAGWGERRVTRVCGYTLYINNTFTIPLRCVLFHRDYLISSSEEEHFLLPRRYVAVVAG